MADINDVQKYLLSCPGPLANLKVRDDFVKFNAEEHLEAMFVAVAN